MLRSIFSMLLLIGFVLPMQSQKKIDSIPVPIKTERYGLRVGLDLYKITRSFYDKDYRGIEIVGDYRINKKYYLAAEIGNENKTTDDDQINFTTKGSYFKVGFDYNLHENWLDLENMIHMGLRYGVSTFSQEVNSYSIYYPYPYFNEDFNGSARPNYDGLSAQWLEVVVGVKTRVVNNFFVGFSFRLNRLVTNQEPGGFENLYIPGYNRKYSGDFGVGFNYTVSYFLPLYKKKIQPKKATPN